jgi:hypothetical protein
VDSETVVLPYPDRQKPKAHETPGHRQSGLTEPTDRTEPARSGTGLPVRFGREPAGNRANSNLNSNRVVQSVRTGIPTGLSGIPGRFGGKPVQK